MPLIAAVPVAGLLALALFASPLAEAAAQVVAPAGGQVVGQAVASAPRAVPAAPLASELEALPEAEDVRLLLRDGSVLTGRLQSLQAGQLVLAAAASDGAPRQVPLDDLVSLVQGTSSTEGGSGASGLAVSAPDLLDLAPDTAGARAPGQPPAGGDRLVGRLLGGNEYGLRFQLTGALPFEVPFELIARLLPHASGPVDRLALLPGAEADDRLWRLGKDGTPDSLTGVVESVSGNRVVFSGALGTREFPIAEVLSLVFAPDGRTSEPLPGSAVIVRLRDGSRLQAGLLEWGGGRCVLATRFAERLELPSAAVSSLVRLDGAVALLAELVPTGVEQWPTYGAPEDFLFPWRKDLSVTGQLLAVGGVARATGLGVHSNSRLSFRVPAGAARLLVTAGLCDEVTSLPARGTLAFEVRVDGALAAATGLVVEGERARSLEVSGLRGGELLELLATDGGDDDAGDRAAWVDGVFLGPAE